MRKTLAIVMITAMATVASAADPTLSVTSADLGNGWTGYTFTCTADTAMVFALEDFVATPGAGTSFGALQGYDNRGDVYYDINTLSDANYDDGYYGYSKALDSWYFDDKFAQFEPNQLNLATDGIQASILGTGSNAYASADVLYIAANGAFSYSALLNAGSQATGTNTYNVSGTVPEPTTMALLGVGVVGLLRRRRRAA